MGMTIPYDSTKKERNVGRIDNAMKTTELMRASGIHEERMTSSIVLRLCKMMVVPKPCYRIHLLSATEVLMSKLKSPEKVIIKLMLGVYIPSRKARLHKVAGFETLMTFKVWALIRLMKR